MAVTIKDIARETGLGLATISSYLNGGSVREKNRLKIEQAIDELQYEVNEIARNLKTNQTKTIGIVIPELSNVFFTAVIATIEDTLRHQGYASIVCDCRSDLKREEEAIKFLYKKRVDGLIFIPCSSEQSSFLPFYKSNRPVIVLDRMLSYDSCDYILVNHKDAVYEGVKELINLGHRNIAFLRGPRFNSSAEDRYIGYELALQEHGITIKDDLIIECDYTVQGGMLAMEELLSNQVIHGKPKITAVILSNYDSTLGGMISIHNHSFRIAEDISVIGYDNIEFAKASNPNLDIIVQPTKEMGESAGNRMLAHLSNKELEKKVITLDAYRLKGKSIAPLSAL